MIWVDEIEAIVTQVQGDSRKPAALDAGAPYYMHGHIRDIQKQLTDKSSGSRKFQMFPIIALIQDFEETIGETMTVENETSLNIVICTVSKNEYDSPQRYDATFRDILYPLYDIFIDKIANYNYFKGVTKGLVPHTKIDRLYWGSLNTSKNTFTEYVDAIEIRNLNLQYINKKC